MLRLLPRIANDSKIISVCGEINEETIQHQFLSRLRCPLLPIQLFDAFFVLLDLVGLAVAYGLQVSSLVLSTSAGQLSYEGGIILIRNLVAHYLFELSTMNEILRASIQLGGYGLCCSPNPSPVPLPHQSPLNRGRALGWLLDSAI